MVKENSFIIDTIKLKFYPMKNHIFVNLSGISGSKQGRSKVKDSKKLMDQIIMYPLFVDSS